MVEEEELSRRLGAAHERLLSGSDGAADEIAQLLLPAMARILLLDFRKSTQEWRTKQRLMPFSIISVCPKPSIDGGPVLKRT